MKRHRRRGAAAAAIAAVAWGGGCYSPTVTLATEKPIEIKIDLQHEVRVHVDREVSAMLETEQQRVGARGEEADDEQRVRAAVARGDLGEQANGYLGVRASALDPADRAAADRVNARRRAAYRELARANGVPLAQVEKTAGAGRLEAAAPGEWIRTPDGHWIEKTDATAVVVQDQSGA